MANVTDLAAVDAFDRVSAGRSAFRMDDLLDLRRLIDRHDKPGKGTQDV
jgi:hypothetical protein